MKNTRSAVTPRHHGVTTAYATNIAKPLYLLGIINGVKHGVKLHEVNTPFTAIHSMA